MEVILGVGGGRSPGREDGFVGRLEGEAQKRDALTKRIDRTQRVGHTADPSSLCQYDLAPGAGCKRNIRTEAGVLGERPFQLFALILQVATASAGAA